jgi:hypothetical protein
LLPTQDQLEFAEMLAKSFAESLDSPVKNILKTLNNWLGGFDFIPEYNPQTDTISFSVKFRGLEKELDLDNILSIPQKMSENSKKPVVIVFDEIQQIKEYPDDYVERKLRSVIQHHSNVTYLFLGSRRHVVEKMFLNKSSPFYRSSKTYPLKSIETSDWIPFLKKHFKKGERKVSENALNKICEITEGHPYYTQHFCSTLWGLSASGEKIEEDVLQEIMERILSEESYTYTSLVESLTKRQRQLLVAIAREEGEFQLYSEDFRQKYRLGNPSTVDTAKKALLKRGLIDKEEKSIYVVDRFFKRWLVDRFHR